jgi:flagellin-like hook-associated protein FlgL
LAAEIRGTDQAIRNALDGQALIDSAEGGHKEIENILQRMREISVQAANDTNDSNDRTNLQAEMNALSTEIDRIASVTTWAGQGLVKTGGSQFSFQVGTATGTKNKIDFSLNAMSSNALNVGSVGQVSTSSHPGQNNTNDLAIYGNHPLGSAHPFFIQLRHDTTQGMITPYTGSNSIDVGSPNSSIVEILGVEYSIPGGTMSAKHDNLVEQLAANGISATAGYNSQWTYYVEVSQTTLSDYISAYNTTGLNFYADPLDNSDGGSNDGDLVNVGLPTLVSDYVKPSISLEPSPSIKISTNALAAITAIDTAIKTVNTQLSELGAVSNRLGHTIKNLTNISTLTTLEQVGYIHRVKAVKGQHTYNCYFLLQPDKLLDEVLGDDRLIDDSDVFVSTTAQSDLPYPPNQSSDKTPSSCYPGSYRPLRGVRENQ